MSFEKSISMTCAAEILVAGTKTEFLMENKFVFVFQSKSLYKKTNLREGLGQLPLLLDLQIQSRITD